MRCTIRQLLVAFDGCAAVLHVKTTYSLLYMLASNSLKRLGRSALERQEGKPRTAAS